MTNKYVIFAGFLNVIWELYRTFERLQKIFRFHPRSSFYAISRTLFAFYILRERIRVKMACSMCVPARDIFGRFVRLSHDGVYCISKYVHVHDWIRILIKILMCSFMLQANLDAQNRDCWMSTHCLYTFFVQNCLPLAGINIFFAHVH